MKTKYLTITILFIIAIFTTACNNKSVQEDSTYWQIVSLGKDNYKMRYTPKTPQDQIVSVKLINKRDTLDLNATCSIYFAKAPEWGFGAVSGLSTHMYFVFNPADDESKKQMEKINKTNKNTFTLDDVKLNSVSWTDDIHWVQELHEYGITINMGLWGSYDLWGILTTITPTDVIPHTMRIKTKNAVLETTFLVNREDFINKWNQYAELFKKPSK